MNIPLIIVILYVILLFGISIYVSYSQKKDSENFLLYKGKNNAFVVPAWRSAALRRSVSRRTRLPLVCRQAGMIPPGRSVRSFLLCWQSVICGEASTRLSAVL